VTGIDKEGLDPKNLWYNLFMTARPAVKTAGLREDLREWRDAPRAGEKFPETNLTLV
jgi:hypothetical protein